MATFDFVTDEDLRFSLESDYVELQTSFREGAWKAAHVLAGSIIEAVLVDYLIAFSDQRTSLKDPLKMEFVELIAEGVVAKALSTTTASLSSVVRSYRNLIHPGRVVRLNERITQNSARVAVALVDIIVDEVSETKRKTYGYTAEQIISKLEQDPSVMGILAHLLKETNRIELERLLLHLLPSRYFEISVIAGASNEQRSTLTSLVLCFRLVFSEVSDDVKRKSARRFVTILKEESGEYVQTYEANLFQGGDLKYLDDEEQSMAKDHLIERLRSDSDLSKAAFIGMINGLGQFLTSVEDGRILAFAILRELEYYTSGELIGRGGFEYYKMTKEAQIGCKYWVLARLKEAKERSDESAQANLNSLLVEFRSWELESEIPEETTYPDVDDVPF